MGKDRKYVSDFVTHCYFKGDRTDSTELYTNLEEYCEMKTIQLS